MLSHTNPSINNPQALQTEPNSQLSAPPSSYQTPTSRPIPRSLLALLILLILQLSVGIAVLVLKVVFGYRGFDNAYPMVVDLTQCTDVDILIKYYGSELKILSITLVMISVCVLLTIILLIMTIVHIVRAKRLPYSTRPQSPLEQLSMATLYRIISHKTRVAMYILQSLVLLCAIVVLGYYLSYFINAPSSTCTWSTYDNTHILVIWILSAVLFLVGWFVWLIIVIINIKNNRQEVYRYEYAEECAQEVKNIDNTYNTVNNNTYNTLNTEGNANNRVTQTDRKQPINNNRYRDPLLYKQTEKEKQPYTQQMHTINRENQSINMGTNVGRYLQPNSYINNQADPQHSNRTPINNINNSSAANSTKNNNMREDEVYQNPIFKSRKQLYESPYKRIENGKYYEGSRQQQLERERDRNNREISLEKSAIEEKDKEKQFQRSRFNSNPKEYKTNITEEDQYLRTLSRYRIEHEQRISPSRPIYPQAKHTNSPGGNLVYEGGTKARLHSSYFKDETSMLNKKRYENSDEKKKRKGILNDYIRSRYADG